jgi:hypothetical protein
MVKTINLGMFQYALIGMIGVQPTKHTGYGGRFTYVFSVPDEKAESFQRNVRSRMDDAQTTILKWMDDFPILFSQSKCELVFADGRFVLTVVIVLDERDEKCVAV